MPSTAVRAARWQERFRGILPSPKADLEHGLVEKRAELEDILEETHEEEERLKEKALELEKKIEPRLLASFKRIRKGARNGLGIVYVQLPEGAIK